MDTDFAYVAGLLRDIGRLALLVKYPESYTNLLAVTREHAFDIRTVERDVFDIDHCEAGAWLMQRMPFPPELVEVAGHHHDTIVGDSPFGMVQLVRVADRTTDALGFAVLPSSSEPTVDETLSELPEAFRRRGPVYSPGNAAQTEAMSTNPGFVLIAAGRAMWRSLTLTP